MFTNILDNHLKIDQHLLIFDSQFYIGQVNSTHIFKSRTMSEITQNLTMPHNCLK